MTTPGVANEASNADRLHGRRGMLVGAGYFSQFHLDAWQRIPNAEIVCVCDQDLDRAKTASERYGIRSYTDDIYCALRENSFDFIDVATGPKDRFSLLRAILEQHIPVICQKPLGESFADACRIIELAETRDSLFMVHENFRFQPWYREIQDILKSEIVGNKLQNIAMRTRMGDGWGEDAYLNRQPYFRTMPRLLVHETGVHFIDTFRYLAGEVVECSARLRKLNPAIAGEDACWLQLVFENGAVAIWDADRYHESRATDARYTFGDLCVDVDGGSIWLDHDGMLTVKPLGEPPYQHSYQPPKNGFAGDCVFACQSHFIDVLDGKSICETSASEYLKTLRVVEAAYESDRLGRPIDLSTDLQSISGAAPSNSAEPKHRVIDLSLPISNTMAGVSISEARDLETDGWNATTLQLYSHAGTHVDAPRHFLPTGKTIDQQDLSVCVGPARLIDLTPIQPKQQICVADIESRTGTPPKGARLLLRTDWHQHYGTQAYRDELPRLSVPLAEWLVAHQVALIGVEPPSVADVNNLDEVTQVHQILLAGGVFIVEGLAHLNQIQGTEFEFIALPLRVVAGDGCPVRAIAREIVS